MFPFTFLIEFFFGKNYFKKLSEANYILLNIYCRDNVQLKYLKSDIKVIFKHLKKYRIETFLKDRPGYVEKILRGILRSSINSHLPTKLSSSFLKRLNEDSQFYCMCVDMPPHVYQEINSKLRCFDIDHCNTLPSDRIISCLGIEATEMEKCEHEYYWETCDSTSVDLTDGECCKCSTVRIDNKKELARRIKSFNKFMNTNKKVA